MEACGSFREGFRGSWKLVLLASIASTMEVSPSFVEASIYSTKITDACHIQDTKLWENFAGLAPFHVFFSEFGGLRVVRVTFVGLKKNSTPSAEKGSCRRSLIRRVLT